MKTKFIAFLMLLCFIKIDAQISNLSELVRGELQLFSPIKEANEDLYGYFTLSKLEEVSENEERFEYVILDKNLNKVANGEFIDPSYKKHVFTKYFRPEKIGDKLILSKQYYAIYNRLYTLHRTIDLSTNTVSKSFYADEGQFKEGFRVTERNLVKDLKNHPVFELPIAIHNGFMLYEIPRTVNKKYKRPLKSIKAYNIDKTKKWEHTYNNSDDEVNSIVNFIGEECIITTLENAKTKDRSILSIDASTGKQNYIYEFEDQDSEYSHVYNIKQLEAKTIIVGKYSAYSKFGYDYKKALGLFKIELDEEGNEISKKYFKWADAGGFLQMDKLGRLEERYRLHAKSYFIFKNEKISILTEKLKEGYSLLTGPNVKTEDFVLLDFDEDFKLINVETLEKDKSKWFTSDYLFSQYVNDGNGVVFFYRDLKKDEETRKKNWVLGIVSLVKGKMTHEKIPMSSKEHFIYPYVAKEGYILLREFNKDDDYHQIRLERLNY